MPYRDGKPLADVIPPDRRRQKAIGLVIAGAVGGAIAVMLLHPADSKPPAKDPPDPPPSASRLAGPLTQTEVTKFVANHHERLSAMCFLVRDEPASAKVHLTVDIDKDGEVTRSSYEGSDSRVTVCVDKEVRQWRFPAHIENSAAMDIPISFDRT